MPALERMFVDTHSLEFRALLAGLPVVLMCGLLSVVVVVKRLGFVGQGVSHSAFGGVGVAALLAVLLPASFTAEGGIGLESLQFLVIIVFCIGAALGMAAVSNRREVPADTAIGMFLVGSMALGAVLVHVSRQMPGGTRLVQSWESILFGSVFLASNHEIVTGWCVCAAVVILGWWYRRPLLFWTFDEESSPAFGIRGRAMKNLLMVLLAVAVVVAMKVAGVVLATALLVLPGATALRVSRRLGPVMLISVAAAAAGLVSGVLISSWLDWQSGPSMVLVLIVLFAGAAAFAAGQRLRRAEETGFPVERAGG